ncbi:hypothetical protein ECANGB1_1881 [Enterospora canceri]|uniref:Uncharacterized protein n=1 Tax=Enterospora canceri TaxID=1081671 RepID=A0A1Y1S8X6_9MICR|nr:hypothetical protein ECANGB1_1881 [Enterospora canceri]
MPENKKSGIRIRYVKNILNEPFEKKERRAPLSAYEKLMKRAEKESEEDEHDSLERMERMVAHEFKTVENSSRINLTGEFEDKVKPVKMGWMKRIVKLMKRKKVEEEQASEDRTLLEGVPYENVDVNKNRSKMSRIGKCVQVVVNKSVKQTCKIAKSISRKMKQ